MEATCWSDYACPWCYVGQDRTELMRSLGLRVVHRPFELHPEIPPSGLALRAGGRLDRTYARVGDACRAVDLPFQAPTRVPNTRRALETAEWVRVHHPDAADAVHVGIFHAHFAAGLAIDEPGVLDQLVADAGAPVDEVRAAVASGEAGELVDASMAEARRAGVSGTPAWVLDDGFTIPGALDRDTLQRWITKVVARSTATPRPATG